MKHKIILIVTGILLFSACVFSSKLFKSNELSLDEKEKTKQIREENTLSMMIEQTAGAGDYKMETRSTWPTDGYMFNETLSKCENGGELGWDSEKGVVTMTGNMSDKCYIYFDIYVPPKDVSDVCSGGETLSGCVITLSQESSPSYTNIYYHDSSLTNGAGDNSYRYAGGDSDYYACTYNENLVNAYDITYDYDALNSDCQSVYEIKLVDGNTHYLTNEGVYNYINYDLSNSEDFVRVDMQWNEEYDACYDADYEVYFIDVDGNNLTAEMCTGQSYNEYGGISLVGSATVNKITQTPVNNYVCFGSDEATCPTDNLYRIIGVFGDQVKLIKSTSIGSMKWDSSSNTWSTAILNTYLNGTYLTNLGDSANMITTTTWKVGGNTYDNITGAVPKTVYANEITSPVTTNTTDSATTYSAKIGLMYVSDYGFAADSSTWATALKYCGSYTSVNWVASVYHEWTISRDSGSSTGVFGSEWWLVDSWDTRSTLAVRPVFYLTSSATYSSGVGTSDNPYRLE